MGWLGRIFGGATGADSLKATLGIVDSLVTKGAEKSAVRQSVLENFLEAQSAVIVAEAQGNWLSKSWRPLTMLSFVGILIYTFFIGPMMNWKIVPIPPDLWVLLKLGIGGYIGGRSVEKIMAMSAPGRKLRKLMKQQAKNGD